MLKPLICILLATCLTGCAAGGEEEVANDTPTLPALPGMKPAAAPSEFTKPSQLVTGLQAQPTQASAPVLASSAGSAAAPPPPLPTSPAGARFSIFCESFNGLDHVEYSKQLRNLLTKNSKLKDWYVIHQAGQSSLYHGYYAEFDPKSAGADKAMKRDADRAQRDHQLLESIPNPTAPEAKLFPRSIFVPLDAPDPDAPPAWNLTNAPGFWTVQVAAFTGAERKQMTVAAVKEARATNIPAFYYHGETTSSVCIGAWDRSAVKEQDVALANEQGVDKNARDEGEFVVNYGLQPLSESDKQQMGTDGKKIRVLEAKIEVNDPTLLATLKQYPEQAVDGYAVMIPGTDKRTGQKVMRPRPSMIVMIPRDERNTDATAGARSSEPVPSLISPNGRLNDLPNRLKGIGQ